MKKINLLLIVLLTFSSAIAQNYAPVSTEQFTFSTGAKEVFKTTFSQVNKKQVESALKDYLKNYKAKLTGVKGASDEYTVTDVVLTNINQTTTNMTIKLSEVEENATMYIEYVNNGIVINSKTPEQFTAYKEFTEAIANKAVFYAYDDVIATKEDELKTKEKELKGLEKDEKNENNNIANAEKSIKDSESAITSLNGNLAQQQSLVANKKQEVSDKEAEIASLSVKTLESNIKDIEKDNKSLEKDIEKERENIAKVNGEIAIEATNLENLRKQIEVQKEMLAVTADKKTLKEVQSLQKDETKIIGEIEELKGENNISQANIDKNLTAIETNNARISSIRAQIASHNEDALKDQLKILEKDLKDLEKEQSKIEKEIEKENSNIAKQEDNIRKAKTEIQNLQAAQASASTEIKTMESDIKSTKSTQAKFK